MQKIIFICGFLWIIAGSFFLSINVSIKSAPDYILALQDRAYIYLIIYFIVGVVFIYVAMIEGKRKKYKIIQSYAIKLLTKNNFKISHLEYSMNCGQNPVMIQKYFVRHMKEVKGGLLINSHGIISFDYKNIVRKGKTL